MAVATRVTRVANPKRGRARRNARRKMSAKQIRHFGTKRQKAALKAVRKRKATVGSARKRKSNPKRKNSRVKIIYRTKANPRKKARRRRSNPALLVTLGSINPKRRTSKVAKRRRRTRTTRRRARARVSNPIRRRRRVNRVARRRRSNPRRRVVAAAPRRRRRTRRMTNGSRRRVNRRHYRRNPAIFGRSGGKDLIKMAAGVVAGVAVTKLIPGWVPASIASSIPTGGVMAVVVSAASAWITGFALGKLDPEFGQAAMLGGFAQTISVAMNVFLPSSISGTFSLGDLVNGNFVVPQNPLRQGGMGGGGTPAARMTSSYPPAY